MLIIKIFFLALLSFYTNKAFSFEGKVQKSKIKNLDIINLNIEKSNNLKLYENKQWLLLLHYHNKKSFITDEKFFISKYGYKNPKLELEESIKYLLNNIKNDNKNFKCRFPARYNFITEQLKIDTKQFDEINCNDFKNFKKKLLAKSIYVVFVSENLSIPTSMMGHILIKIKSENNGYILNDAISYFADYKNENLFKFYINSLFYGTKGYYYVTPYDVKIMEYLYNEKRSLWEYKLNLNHEEINNFIDHLWEIKGINIKYNFIKHNCVTAIENLIYIAKPNINFENNNIFSLNTPINFIKKLKEHNYINNAKLVPSNTYSYYTIENNLNYKDKKKIKNILKTKNIDSISDANTLFILNTLTDNKKNKEFKFKINNKRENLKKHNLNVRVNDILKSNYSSRILIGYKLNNNKKNIIKFNFMPVYNDIYANNYQYFNDFELKLFNLNFEYNINYNKIILQDFNIIKLKNIVPSDTLINSISSQINIGFENDKFNTNTNKLFPKIDLGIGKAKKKFKNLTLLYTFLNVGYSYYNGDNIYILSPEFGFFIYDTNYTKLNFNYRYYYTNKFYKNKHSLSLTQSIFLKENNEIYIKYNLFTNYRNKHFSNISIDYAYYF